MKRTLLFLFTIYSFIYLSAQIPTNYYSGIAGKKDAALLSALHGIIDNHTEISYSALEDYYQPIDFRYNSELDADTLCDIYSTCRFTMAHANRQQNDFCDGWNKEHTVPQSWFNEATPMKSDLFHVLPTDARVNNLRSNYPYGETASRNDKVSNGKKALGHLGASSFSGYTNIGSVYEPDDQFKGDIARIYFYMVARYLDRKLSYSNGSYVFTYNNGTTGLTDYSIALLMKWHRQDPVSQKEIDRNDSVYAVQHNRNPFVDYPYLAEYIWGKKTATSLDFNDIISAYDYDFVPGESSGIPGETNPALRCVTSTLIYPAIMQGEELSLSFELQGYRLTNGISCAISGDDAGLFSVTPSYIDAADANAVHTFTVTYSPTALGNHSAVITLSSQGADSYSVNLFAFCAQSCNVTWQVNGISTTAGDPTALVALGGNVSFLPDAPAACSDYSNTFMGWTAAQLSSPSTEAPEDLFEEAEAAPVVNGDVTYHAVFAHVEGSEAVAAVVDTANLTTGYSNAQEITSPVELPHTTVTFAKGGSSNPPKYYTTGTAIRCYGGNTITVTGANITYIYLVFDDGGNSNAITADSGTMSDVTKTNATWTSDVNSGVSSVVFSIGGSSGNRRVQYIYITSSGKESTYVYSNFITSCGGTTDLIEQSRGEDNAPRKVLRNGHIYIQRENKIYNILGL